MEGQLEQLTELLAKQADMAQKREERLAMMLETMMSVQNGNVNENRQRSGGAEISQNDAQCRYKIPHSATPAPHLSSSVSLKEFDAWRHKFEGYAMLTGIKSLTPAEQRSVLASVLDEDWTRTLRYGLSFPADADLETILNAMESHLRGQRNVIVDRREFYLRKQETGESFDDFLCGIREIAAFCDFCSSCMDNRLRDRIVVGTRDEQALKRMLEEKDLNLQKAVDICRASESANENSATIRGMIPDNISKVSRYKRDYKKAPNSLYKKERCFRCGRDRHSDMNVCKARDKKCSQCGKIGHFAAVCRSTGKETSSLLKKSKDSKLKSTGSKLNRDVHRIVSDVYVNSAISQATPKVQIHITHPAGNSSILWTPDSGAEATVMGLNVARSLGIYPYMLEPSKIGKLCSAGYQTLNCVGAFTSHLSLGDRQTKAEITVVKEVKGALLSWFDSIALGILPEDFPAQINSLPVRLSVNPDEEKRLKDYKEKEDSTCREVHSPVALPRWPYERDPTEGERAEHAAALVSAFPRVFGATKILREMHGGPMHIKLSENARPFAVTAPRTIPYSWRSEIKDQLDELLEKDVICKVEHPTEWCHPIVPVAKKPNGVRLCVDLTKLNRYVCRPTYPVRSPHDAVASISTGAMWFSTLDAKMGYFQIKIAEEDQDLTCFITPWGRYKFKRAVMGLISSGDEYNRRGDQALGDIPQTVKIVDDILAYDYSYKDHLAHIISILQRCDEYGITLNDQKICFAKRVVDFCGYKISSHGYTVDSRKVMAIADFPVPQNITDLRSFMGLVNQLGSFSSVIAREAQPLRDLLKQRNEWCWTAQHDLSFRRVKEALTAPPVLAHFDATLPTMLQTDASRLHGLGFALLQKHGTDWKLTQCGSRFLSDVETRYSVIELEMTAVLWSIKKCHTYLAGLPHFDVVIDHRPLIPILNSKSLGEIENPRLQRMREKLSNFSFTVHWQKGSAHCIPDALSRAPVQDPTEENCLKDDGSTDPLHVAMVNALDMHEDGVLLTPLKDKTLEKIRAAAEQDAEYNSLREIIMKGFPEHCHNLEVELRPFWNIRDMLAVDDDLIVYGARLLIPKRLRRETLECLHDGHQGIDRTKRRARQTVYWPKIDRDIENIVSSCIKCRSLLPNQRNEPLWQEEDQPSRVFESVSADYFHAMGRTYLVYVDRLSGWPCISSCQGIASAANLIRSLRAIFSDTGVPVLLKTDGGPQFAASALRRFLSRWGVEHRITSPYNPKANGHAEASVKIIKKLIMTTTKNGNLDADEFARGMLELRNTPRADGRSPAQVLFGHPLRSFIPTHRRSFAKEWQRKAEECDVKAEYLRSQAKQRYDSTARPLSHLKMGSYVDVQDHNTKLWNRPGVVVGIGSRRDYLIKLGSGRILWRNRKFLRPHRPFLPIYGSSLDATNTPNKPKDGERSQDNSTAEVIEQPVSPTPAPRRSLRHKKEPDRLQVKWNKNTYE